VRFGDRPNDRETRTGASPAGGLNVALRERLERPGQEVWRKAGPTVRDYEAGEAIEAPGADPHDAHRSRLANGVLQEIPKCPLDSIRSGSTSTASSDASTSIVTPAAAA